MTAVLPFPGPPTLAEARARRQVSDYDRLPLDPDVLRAVGLDPDVAECAGCGLPLVGHFGPLAEGEGPYAGLWYGSDDCAGPGGPPGSAGALMDEFGTTDPLLLGDLPFVLPEERVAAEMLAIRGQVAA